MNRDKRILVTRSSLPPFDEYCDEIKSIWKTHWLSNRGEKHKVFEEELQDYLEVPHATLFVNGHNALECILETYGFQGEIITTPFTFASTTHAIVRTGSTPVFCDVRPDNLTLDPTKIEDLITDKTVAILPVHVFGNLCDVEGIQEVANRHGLKVIYDAAHAFGVKYRGHGVGNFGDASMFSFHATKVFNSIEGGAITYDDPSLVKPLEQWRNFGIEGEESVAFPGGNAKLNEFAAAMGVCSLRHVDDWIAARRSVAERYFDRLDDVPGISVWRPERSIRPNYCYMPITIDPELFGADRNDVYDALDYRSISARKYFYPLTSDFSCYRDQYDSNNTPVAKVAAERVLTLPMYDELALEDVDRICDVLLSTRVQ